MCSSDLSDRFGEPFTPALPVSGVEVGVRYPVIDNLQTAGRHVVQAHLDRRRSVRGYQQAIVRADPSKGDKGGDAARAALSLHLLKQKYEAR